MFEFLRTEARWVGAGMLLTGFSSFGQTYFISLSNTAFREAFGLSHGALGLLYAVATLTSAFILLEFGKIVDKRSTRVSAIVVIIGLAGACVITSMAQNMWMLLPALLGLRLFGQGMMGHVAMTATGRWFDAQRGRAVSIVALGYPISEAILPPLAVLMIAAIGWRQSWLACAAVLIVVTLPAVAALLARERVPHGHVEAEAELQAIGRHQWRRADVMSEPSFWLMLCGVLCPPFMMTGLFFHQLHLVEVKDWTPALFASGFTVFAFTAIVFSLIAGGLVDKVGARTILPIYLLPMAAGLCLPYLFDGIWVIYGLMFLMGVTGGAAGTVMGAIWPELYGTRHLGEIRALSFCAMVASSAASPFLLGYLIDQGIALPTQLAVMGGYALLASALMGLIQPRLSAIANDTVWQTGKPVT